MTINNVTCSRAASAQRKAGMVVERALYACVQDATQEGPGTELKKLIERWLWWLSKVPGLVRQLDEATCRCDALRVAMNNWGVAGCRKRREFILDRAIENAHKAFGFARWLPVRWQLGRLFERAMRNDLSESKKRQASPNSRAKTKCPYAEHGICQMATRIGGAVATLDAQACEACLKQAVPMSTNRITAALACEARQRAGLSSDRELSQMALGIYSLAGFRVERKIHQWLKRIHIAPPQECGCEGLVSEMNRWGAEGSLERIDVIVDALHGKATNLPAITSAGITRSTIRRVLTKWLSNARS